MLVTKHSETGKWIICVEVDGMIESDEIAERRGQWNTRKLAVGEAERMMERAQELADWGEAMKAALHGIHNR